MPLLHLYQLMLFSLFIYLFTFLFQLHAANVGIQTEKLEHLRISIAKGSPMWETLDICINVVDTESLDPLVPRLAQLVRSGVGLNTRYIVILIHVLYFSIHSRWKRICFVFNSSLCCLFSFSIYIYKLLFLTYQKKEKKKKPLSAVSYSSTVSSFSYKMGWRGKFWVGVGHTGCMCNLYTTNIMIKYCSVL